MRSFLVAVFVLVLMGSAADAQPPHADSTRIDSAKHNDLWFWWSFGLDLNNPNVGSGDNVFGYFNKVGVTFQHYVFLLTNHATRDERVMLPREEHRYDYAALLGVSTRTDGIITNLAGGVSYIDYALRGNVITPPSCSTCEDGNYQLRSGYGVGPAAMLDFYFTPITKYGGMGLGLYWSFVKRVSYFALDLSFIEINLPIGSWFGW